MRAIIADDELNVRDGIVSVVQEVASDVRIIGQATTVAEVEELVRIHQPEIVLLDIRMPGGTGLDAIEHIGDSILPLWIVITSFPLFEYAKKAISLSVFDYLLKPVSAGEMKRTLDLARVEVGRRLRDVRDQDDLSSSDDEASRTRDLAELAKEHITMQFNRPIGIAQIADQLRVSPNYLSTAFRERHGETPLRFLNRLRMEESVRLLLKGCRVKEVAPMVGLSDVRYFSRMFTKYWGEKPSEYVRRRRKP